MDVWICGRYRSGVKLEVVWDFHGVFSTEALAVSACKDKSYFVAPAKMDVDLPHEIREWPGAYYPLMGAAEGKDEL